MYYIAERGNTSDESQFLQHIATIATDYQEDIMTIAEQLEAKGEQRGIQKGIQLGEQKGRQETTTELARKFLANGVERSIVKLSTGLSDHELDELARQ